MSPGSPENCSTQVSSLRIVKGSSWQLLSTLYLYYREWEIIFNEQLTNYAESMVILQAGTISVVETELEVTQTIS